MHKCLCQRRCKCNANKEKAALLGELERSKWEELCKMEKEVKTAIQVKHFLKERREIAAKGIKRPNARVEMLSRGSPLNPHNPFMDSDGLIRVGSRLIHSDLPEEEQVAYANGVNRCSCT